MAASMAQPARIMPNRFRGTFPVSRLRRVVGPFVTRCKGSLFESNAGTLGNRNTKTRAHGTTFRARPGARHRGGFVVVHRGLIPCENKKTTVLPVVCFVKKCPRKGSHVSANQLAAAWLHGLAHGTPFLTPQLAIIPQTGGRPYLPDVILNTA